MTDGDENGILFYLGSYGQQAKWENPGMMEMILVGSSEMMHDSEKNLAIVGRRSVRCVTKPAASCFFVIDLVNKYIQPTHYSLRHYASWDTECLRNWDLEGSIDGNVWLLLRKHVNDESLNGRGKWFTWEINSMNLAFSRFRIKQT